MFYDYPKATVLVRRLSFGIFYVINEVMPPPPVSPEFWKSYKIGLTKSDWEGGWGPDSLIPHVATPLSLLLATSQDIMAPQFGTKSKFYQLVAAKIATNKAEI
jgi:hypothetical protein